MNTLKYKDFIASIRYSEEDEVFVGKIEGINSVVSFEGESVSELKEAFAEAAEDYLDFCKRKGIEPQKHYTGAFNVRLTPELHRIAAFVAKREGFTLNGFIRKAVERELHDLNFTV